MSIDRVALLADLREQGIRSAVEVVEPQEDGTGAAYIADLDELAEARRVLQDHPALERVRIGPTGLAWTLLFQERQA